MYIQNLPEEVQAVHPPNRSIWPFRKEGRRHQLRPSLNPGAFAGSTGFRKVCFVSFV